MKIFRKLQTSFSIIFFFFYFSLSFYSVCEDDDIQRNDHNCWTGDRVGDYTQLVMAQGVDTQRYNPEVPLEVNSQSTKLNELVDKLIKVRKNIGAAVSVLCSQHFA